MKYIKYIKRSKIKKTKNKKNKCKQNKKINGGSWFNKTIKCVGNMCKSKKRRESERLEIERLEQQKKQIEKEAKNLKDNTITIYINIQRWFDDSEIIEIDVDQRKNIRKTICKVLELNEEFTDIFIGDDDENINNFTFLELGINENAQLRCFYNFLDKLKDEPSLNDLKYFINEIYSELPNNIKDKFDKRNFDVVINERKSEYSKGYYIGNKRIEDYDTPITQDLLQKIKDSIKNLPQPCHQREVWGQDRMKQEVSDFTNLYESYIYTKEITTK